MVQWGHGILMVFETEWQISVADLIDTAVSIKFSYSTLNDCRPVCAIAAVLFILAKSSLELVNRRR